MSEDTVPVRPGMIISADLTIGQPEEVRDFYKQVVGWGHSEYKRGEYTDYFMTTSDERLAAGICQKAGALSEFPSVWLVYFGVADLTASLQACVELGGRIVVEPSGAGTGSYAIIEYPPGAVCGLSQI